eukprot:Gb_33699 [translate_table: standard]
MFSVGVAPIAGGCSSSTTASTRKVLLSTLAFSSNSSSTSSTLEQLQCQQFTYSRASPSVRWPHLKLREEPSENQIECFSFPLTQSNQDQNPPNVSPANPPNATPAEEDSGPPNMANFQHALDKTPTPSRRRIAKKLSKLALKRAKDWRKRVQRLSDVICKLNPNLTVADVLENWTEQLAATDYCFVVKQVGQKHWRRALEIYEWLNLRHWYSPSARMLSTMLAVLGRANQPSLAEEIFQRVEPAMGNCVQVYNAMMGVYARYGGCEKVQDLLQLMRSKGCEPDLVTFNILINARTKAGRMVRGSAIDLLHEVRRAGLRPDVITYNTLISACAAGCNSSEAKDVFRDMEQYGCEPDLWTYNAMISVYGRSGMDEEAEELMETLQSRGFFPDAVTYNALLYAFARNGKVEKVDTVRRQMASAGYRADEITYNTMIHMYGKQGVHENAFLLYEEMKASGCCPDAVTFTVLIDSLGKAGLITEAVKVFSEISETQVRPTLRTFSALICAYAKAGMHKEAEETYDCMVRTGIKPDCLAYSVILDVLQKANNPQKAMTLCRDMVQEGIKPDPSLYESMLQLFLKEDKQEDAKKLIKDMELSSLDPSTRCIILIKAKCNEQAAEVLKSAAQRGYSPDHETLLAVFNAYRFSNRYTDARSFISFFSDLGIECSTVLHEALIVMLVEGKLLEAAREEFEKFRLRCPAVGSSVYEALIIAYEQAELLTEASQLYSDLQFYGVHPTFNCYRSMAMVYCKMGFPETAHHLVGCIAKSGVILQDFSIHVALMEAYGKQKLWQKAESVFGQLRLLNLPLDGKVWNALIHSYAESGRYEQGRAMFNQMLEAGLSPTADTINGLMQALINADRLEDLQILAEEMQQMDFRISKSTILLMLYAFAKVGNIPEVKKIYHGMKAAGYLPNMQLFRTLISLLSKGKQVRDAELVLDEMKGAGFKPDISIYNSMLSLYTDTGNSKKTIEVYQGMRAAGFAPDKNTYNILICMYSRHLRTEEAFAILKEMKRLGCEPTIDSYKALLSVCGRLQLWDETESLFRDMQANSFKVDRSAYHIMMKAYRSAGEHKKAEKLLVQMKISGIEPNLATMHMLMDSYGKGGQPEEAEKVFKDLQDSGLNLGTVQYNCVINAYLKSGDHAMGLEKLMKMRADGFEPDYRTWTCIIGAASLCKSTSKALNLLSALRDAGFALPIRLLTENSAKAISEVETVLEQLQVLGEEAGIGFVNVIEDLLWAFERRATATWIFQMAIEKKIYPQDVFRVENKDWGADFRRLSAGAALVGLTLWMDHMQDASLQGVPESSKSVVLITGSSVYNNIVSVNKTLKAYLWEMGSPFLPSKTHSGLLIAKGHSLRMWLKDSPFCMDLELKDCLSLPDFNSMQIYEGSFMRAELVSTFKQIGERMGEVRPKKFSRLALLSEEKRDKAISADIEGRKEVLEKRKINPTKKFRLNRRKGLKHRARV